VHAEGSEGAVGVDDVKANSGLFGGWVGGAVQEGGFQLGDAIEAPGGVGELLGELVLGGGGGLVFIEELEALTLVFGWVFHWRGREIGWWPELLYSALVSLFRETSHRDLSVQVGRG